MRPQQACAPDIVVIDTRFDGPRTEIHGDALSRSEVGAGGTTALKPVMLRGSAASLHGRCAACRVRALR